MQPGSNQTLSFPPCIKALTGSLQSTFTYAQLLLAESCQQSLLRPAQRVQEGLQEDQCTKTLLKKQVLSTGPGGTSFGEEPQVLVLPVVIQLGHTLLLVKHVGRAHSKHNIKGR